MRRSVLLVASAYAILLAWMWLLPTAPYAKWQREHLHWNYGLQVLFFVIPVTVLATRRRSPQHYGLAFRDLRLHGRLALNLAFGRPWKLSSARRSASA